jgi:hypothetical protein
MDSTDGLSRGYEVVLETQFKCQLEQMFTDVFQRVGDAIDGLGNLPKQVKTECQFTVKHQDRRFINFIKFYSQVLK